MEAGHRHCYRSGALALVFVTSILLCACSHDGSPIRPFTIAMIPDTQNMVDYKHQTAQGFPVDASELFMGQLEFIASNAVMAGGDIAFVTAVGDVWQHQSVEMDSEHAARGFERIDNPWFALEIEFGPEARSIELPSARAGYELISRAELPFAVAPGNHDYDAMWSDARYPPVSDPREIDFTPETLGVLHLGGLDNFRSVFGADTPFFEGKKWYISSHDGGTSSAQRFSAGGYTFLHIALEMSPPDEVLDWAASVVEANPGLPTIISTHDYLDARGERRSSPLIDLKALDPAHNDAGDLWAELISRHDQIFMVLCGHHHGQAIRVDRNAAGHEVYQILADFQNRGQVGLDAGAPLVRNKPVGLGDGWLRLLTFTTTDAVPTLEVRTYSPHYRAYSTALESYAAWYKPHEEPEMTDAEFLKEDDFVIELGDFRSRFGPPGPPQ